MTVFWDRPGVKCTAWLRRRISFLTLNHQRILRFQRLMGLLRHRKSEEPANTPEQVAVTVEERIYAPEKSIFLPEKCVVALATLPSMSLIPFAPFTDVHGWVVYVVAEELVICHFHCDAFPLETFTMLRVGRQETDTAPAELRAPQDGSAYPGSDLLHIRARAKLAILSASAIASGKTLRSWLRSRIIGS
jgi:hypothetical protein